MKHKWLMWYCILIIHRTESKLKTQSPTKETKSDKNKSKEEVVKSRPRTAPSRSDSRDEGNGKETVLCEFKIYTNWNLVQANNIQFELLIINRSRNL